MLFQSVWELLACCCAFALYVLWVLVIFVFLFVRHVHTLEFLNYSEFRKLYLKTFASLKKKSNDKNVSFFPTRSFLGRQLSIELCYPTSKESRHERVVARARRAASSLSLTLYISVTQIRKASLEILFFFTKILLFKIPNFFFSTHPNEEKKFFQNRKKTATNNKKSFAKTKSSSCPFNHIQTST